MSNGATESVAAIADRVRSGATTAVATVTASLAAIARCNGQLNAFREVHDEHALAAAAAVDRTVAAGGDPGPLAGVPVGLKDNIVADVGTSACGSRMLEDFRSPYAATVVERLRAAGAIIVGRTNCDEFGMGSSTENCAFGHVTNPWDPTRVPGGSSGGSAAAVAAGLCAVALGSDTGGSIRQPAALCGIVGLKPSYGRVSRHGLVAFGSSLDQVGPFTATVTDAARVLGALAGADPRDSTCADAPVPDYEALLDDAPGTMRIGVARQFRGEHNDPAVAAAIEGALDTFRGLGAEIVDLDLPLTDHGIATYYVIAPAEASSNLARYDGVRYGRRATLGPGETLDDLYARSRAEGFGPEVQRRIMLGTYVLSAGYYDAYYKRALQVRRLIREDYDRAFASCDAIVGPTSPVPAFPLGAKTDPLTMYLCDVYTTNANIAGICGISVPCGFAGPDERPLPIGLQIQAQAFDETTLFRVARAYERARGPLAPRPAVHAGSAAG